MYMCVPLFVFVFTMCCWYSEKPEEAVRSPRARVNSSCKLPNMGTGFYKSRIPGFCKRRMCF